MYANPFAHRLDAANDRTSPPRSSTRSELRHLSIRERLGPQILLQPPLRRCRRAHLLAIGIPPCYR